MNAILFDMKVIISLLIIHFCFCMHPTPQQLQEYQKITATSFKPPKPAEPFSGSVGYSDMQKRSKELKKLIKTSSKS